MEPRKPDSDLESAYSTNLGPHKPSEVEDVLAQVPGEADGPSWHWVVKLKDGFAYIDGWCDYSGWGCQDGATRTVAKTAEEAANLAPEKEGSTPIRKLLLGQLAGTEPYGLRKES